MKKFIPFAELNRYVNQPYPYYYTGKRLFQVCAAIFILAFFFNYFIQPFETNPAELKMSFFWVSFIHSLAPLLILVPLSLFLPKFRTENWKVKNEIVFIIIILLLIGIFQFIIRDIVYNNPGNWSWHYLYEEIVHTLLGGSLIAFIVLSTNINLQFLKNQEQASAFNLKLKEKPAIARHSEIKITTELKSETFMLKIEDFIFARAEGNYVEIWTVENLPAKPILKRMKLKDLENILRHFPNILRTHRSYILNKDFIEIVNGNAQGYKINLKDCKELVPVSRNYLATFNEKMNA
ncbi:MAG: LytTR family DNA-binding domain-containing protein [Ginsengibacter sp.]